MAVKKVTIALHEELVEALGVAAREDGVPLSRLVASEAESELRRRVGRQLIADWRAEHGAFAVEERAGRDGCRGRSGVRRLRARRSVSIPYV